MGFNLGQFVIGAGTGYLKGENQNRDRARQDTRDAQDKELFDSRMRRDRMQEEDMVATRADRQTLRTAAKPVVPVDDMIKSPDMDNRDVGLAENASRPDGGLSLAGARVGGTRYATRTEADAAAAKQNTPEATTRRYADAQRSTGDLAGATATEQNFSATLRERQTRAADAMMNEIGKGFMTGGWQGGTEVLSRSGADGNDYRSEIDPVSGKVRMHQTQRDTGKTRVLGEFSNDNSGMLDAYKQIGSAIAGKPDVAMTHIADREKRADALKKEENKNSLGLEKLELMGRRIELQGELGAARIEVARARGQGGGRSADDRTRRDDNADAKVEVAQTREKRLAIKDQTEQVIKKVENRLMTKEEGRAKLADLEKKDAGLAQVEQNLRSSPGLADVKPTKPAAPAAMPKAKAELKSGQVYQTARGPAKWNGTAFEAQ